MDGQYYFAFEFKTCVLRAVFHLRPLMLWLPSARIFVDNLHVKVGTEDFILCFTAWQKNLIRLVDSLQIAGAMWTEVSGSVGVGLNILLQKRGIIALLQHLYRSSTSDSHTSRFGEFRSGDAESTPATFSFIGKPLSILWRAKMSEKDNLGCGVSGIRCFLAVGNFRTGNIFVAEWCCQEQLYCKVAWWRYLYWSILLSFKILKFHRVFYMLDKTFNSSEPKRRLLVLFNEKTVGCFTCIYNSTEQVCFVALIETAWMFKFISAQAWAYSCQTH